MLVIEVLTLRASATALPPSAQRLLPWRLKNEAMIDCGSHDGWFEGNDEQRISSYPPPNELKTRRMWAYSMLVIDVLTLSASPIALPPSGPSSLYERLEK